jgi:hypothetical protein
VAYSGTISQTTFDVRRIIDRAFGRCRIKPQEITPEMISRAMDDLYLMLSNLPAEGTPLWCIEKVLLPLSEGLSGLVTPTGTVDVVNAFYRTLSYVTGTEVNAPAGFSISLASPTVVTTIGLQWSGASVPVTIQHSSDGITWTTITTDTQTAVSGETTWIDIDGSTAKQYWQVLPTTGALSLTTARFANNPTEILMARLNRDQYQQLPNKTFTGRPLQYWFDRKVDRPVMRLWPVPDAAAAANLAVVWRHRHVMDVGTMTTDLEVPQRWMDAIIAKTAAMLAIDTPEVDPSLIPMLQALATKSSLDIWGEERDRSPVQFMTNIGVYTR